MNYNKFLRKVKRIADKKGAIAVDRATFFGPPWCVELSLPSNKKQYIKAYGKYKNITLSKEVKSFSEAVEKGF